MARSIWERNVAFLCCTLFLFFITIASLHVTSSTAKNVAATVLVPRDNNNNNNLGRGKIVKAVDYYYNLHHFNEHQQQLQHSTDDNDYDDDNDQPTKPHKKNNVPMRPESELFNATEYEVRAHKQQVSYEMACYNTPECIAFFQENFPPCPGRYCGRLLVNNGESIHPTCGACGRGERSDGFVCLKCTDRMSAYDISYLVFMFGSVLTIYISAIEGSVKRKLHRYLLEASAVIETVIASIFTVFVYFYNFNVKTCGVRRLSDWYPVFHNPGPGYHCTNEAVFPLYTMVMIYLGFCCLGVFLFRLPVSQFICKRKGRRTIYSALWWLPAILFAHFIFAGLLYYAFPYLLIVLTIIFQLVHTVRVIIGKDQGTWVRRIAFYVFTAGVLVWAHFCILMFFDKIHGGFISIPLAIPLFVELVLGFVMLLVKLCYSKLNDDY